MAELTNGQKLALHTALLGRTATSALPQVESVVLDIIHDLQVRLEDQIAMSEPLNEGGMAALRKERELRKDAERKLREFRSGLYPSESELQTLIRVFQQAWHGADDRGRNGYRTRSGIQAVLRQLRKQD